MGSETTTTGTVKIGTSSDTNGPFLTNSFTTNVLSESGTIFQVLITTDGPLTLTTKFETMNGACAGTITELIYGVSTVGTGIPLNDGVIDIKTTLELKFSTRLICG